MICLSAKHNVICLFFWAPRHHKASHGVSVEARNYNEKNVDLSGPFVTYSYDLISYVLELSIRYDNLFILCDCHWKLRLQHNNTKMRHFVTPLPYVRDFMPIYDYCIRHLPKIFLNTLPL